jgi:hypothetical protein
MKKSENIMLLKTEYLRKGSYVLAEAFRAFQGQSNLFMDQISAVHSFPMIQELYMIFLSRRLLGHPVYSSD